MKERTMEIKKVVEIFKVLSDETRYRIFKMLLKQEICACTILEEFAITQPTLSYHMKKLTACGLIDGRKDGIWMFYSVNKEILTMLQQEMDNSMQCCLENCDCR
jgi:ArsR family transcriptional regulator, arsenate/arsenite/antimonite-responsive transcriptional repressor